MIGELKILIKIWFDKNIRGRLLSIMGRPILDQSLLKAALGSAGVRIAGMFVTFFLGILLARYLGVEQYGVYGTVMSIMAILAVPAQLGLPQLATKEISIAHSKGYLSQIRTVLFWFFVVISFSTLIAILIGYLIPDLWGSIDNSEILYSYYYGLGLIPVISLMAFGMGTLRGLNYVVSAQVYDVLLRPALMILMILLMITYGESIDSKIVFILQVIAGFFAILFCGFHIIRILPKQFHRLEITRFESSWIRTSLPMTGTEVLRVIDAHYPILLLGIFASITDVGLYRVALAIAVLVGFPSALLNLILMPRISNEYAQNNMDQLQKIATGAALVSFSGTIFISMILYFFGEIAIVLFFGNEYSDSWFILILIILGYIINSLFGSAAMILNMCGCEKELMLIFLIGPVFGVFISLVLFPMFEIYSVIIAFIITEIVKNLCMYMVSKKKLNVDVSILV